MEQKSGNKQQQNSNKGFARMQGWSGQHSSILFPLFINVSTIIFFSTNPLISYQMSFKKIKTKMNTLYQKVRR